MNTRTKAYLSRFWTVDARKIQHHTDRLEKTTMSWALHEQEVQVAGSISRYRDIVIERSLRYALPVEYKCAGRGTYVGGAVGADDVAIINGAHGAAPVGGAVGPDAGTGVGCREDGPAAGTGPGARGGRRVLSTRQVTARQNRPHRSTIL